MGLLEKIDRKLVINPLTSTKRDDIIRDLCSLYAREKGLTDGQLEEIIKAVCAREDMASTAMERGIAIPHAKIPFIKEGAVVIGISRIPVDFGGQGKTNIFFLLLASQDNPGEHIQLLSQVAKLCSSDVFVRLLSASKTPDETAQLFFD